MQSIQSCCRPRRTHNPLWRFSKPSEEALEGFHATSALRHGRILSSTLFIVGLFCMRFAIEIISVDLRSCMQQHAPSIGASDQTCPHKPERCPGWDSVLAHIVLSWEKTTYKCRRVLQKSRASLRDMISKHGEVAGRYLRLKAGRRHSHSLDSARCHLHGSTTWGYLLSETLRGGLPVRSSRNHYHEQSILVSYISPVC
jgi:hypothetical protein